MRCGDNKSVKDKILKTIEEIEKTERVWQQNEDWETANISHDWGLKTKFASIPRSTGKFLSELILELKPKTIFEVGSSVGYSTLWMALAAEQFDAKIFATEINTARIEMAKINFKSAAVENFVTLLDYDAKVVLQEWNSLSFNESKQIDFVFLDAFKRDYVEYLDLLYPLLKSGGVIVIDNINTHANLLKNFFEKIETNQQFSFEKLDKDNGIMLLTKISQFD
ncbi:MAG: hypothetical protein JWO40_309 [Candidatus Doudnabacteria bacterium]|nr:hypothetical protein [Candidatus Doudnabacteria bacterium]